MTDGPTWIKEYMPLAVAFSALLVAIFNYVVSRPKTRLEIQKLEKEIEKLSTAAKTTAENISEIQQTINPLPVYQDEQVLYSIKSDNIGFDFQGKGAYVYRDGKPVPGKGAGTLSYPGGGIVSIDRESKDGRYELYLRSYKVGTQKCQFISKDLTGDRPRMFRVACEARAINAKHTLRFVMRNRETVKWIKHEIRQVSSQDWCRLEAHFEISPLDDAELLLSDEDVAKTPSSLQIRRLMLAQKLS